MSSGIRNLVVIMALAAAAVGGFLTYSALTPRPLQPPTVLELPDVSLPDLSGTPRSIRDWAGERGLIINFWATWCAPCLREIPLLTAFQSAQEARAQVLGIAVDRLDDVTAFAPKMNFNYPILVGQADAMAAAEAFGADFLALPFTVFTASGGEILAVHTGEVTAGDLDNYAAVLVDIAAGSLSLEQARRRMAGRL